jgi:hypothetical protein
MGSMGLATPTATIAVLAAALLFPASSTALDRTVSVRGEATVTVPNDSASLGFSVTFTRTKRSTALRAVASRLRDVIAAVQGTPGVGEGDVTTGTISVVRTTRHERNVYRASEGIGVVLHQPQSAGALVSSAIAAGATGTRGPTFFVGDSSAAYAGALAAAFAQAKERATTLAAQAGASLGPVVTIAEEGEVTPQLSEEAKSVPACGVAPVAPGPTSRRCGSTPPVKPGRSTVTATIHVSFTLQ